MKRTVLLFLILLFILQGCAPKEERIHCITGATPKIVEAADASMWPEVLPEEDAGILVDEPPDEETHKPPIVSGQQKHVTFTTMESDPPAAYIEAYTDKKSYLPGETINFHVSTTAATYSIDILKEEWTRKYVGKATGIAGAYYPTPPYSQQPWAEGANWPVSYSWIIPDQWENGNYLALLRTTSGTYVYTYHPFIVRTRAPGSRSKVALIMNYNTRNAYNRWGGKSLYYSGVPGDTHLAVAVSFIRPFTVSYGRGDAYWGSYELTSHLIDEGFNPEFLTERDISSNPAILRAYDVLVFAEHHEYICRNMYDALEAFHKRGGHLAFFSANDIYWQIRFENNGSKMVSYKSYATYEDPIRRIDNSLLTTLWEHLFVNRPAEALKGICYVPYSWCFEQENYIVQDCNHFAFEGTGLKNGDIAGWKVATGETDYFGPYSPTQMDILLSARRTKIVPGYENYVQVSYADAVAIYYEDSPEYGFPSGRGGQIFSAGTHYGWGYSLLSCFTGYETMRKITRNIIQHMVDSPPPPADLRDLAVFVSHWLDGCKSPDWCECADVDMNGNVDMRDFVSLATDWSNN